MLPEPIPWSPENERDLRWLIRLDWIVLLLGVGVLLFMLLRREWSGAILAAVVWVIMGAYLRNDYAKLGEEARWVGRTLYPGLGMLANKPRQTHQLTKWMQHYRAGVAGDSFRCSCGRQLQWLDSKWFPGLESRNEDNADEWELRRPGETYEAFCARMQACREKCGGGREVLLCKCGVGHFRLAGGS
jgi:hypothetical protein